MKFYLKYYFKHFFPLSFFFALYTLETIFFFNASVSWVSPSVLVSHGKLSDLSLQLCGLDTKDLVNSMAVGEAPTES